jgi:hypothetical protein
MHCSWFVCVAKSIDGCSKSLWLSSSHFQVCCVFAAPLVNSVYHARVLGA